MGLTFETGAWCHCWGVGVYSQHSRREGFTILKRNSTLSTVPVAEDLEKIKSRHVWPREQQQEGWREGINPFSGRKVWFSTFFPGRITLSKSGTHRATVSHHQGQGRGAWICWKDCISLKMFKPRFNEILDRFMETFVAPRMAAIEGGEVAEVKIINGSNLHF